MAIDLNTRFAQLQQQIDQSPRDIPALMEMMQIFLHINDEGKAMQVLSHLLGFAPDYLPACQIMAQLLGQLNPQQYHPELEKDLLICWQQEALDHQILAQVTAQHLLNKYQVDGALSAQQLIGQINLLKTDTLFLRFLSRCINIHSACEQWLIQIRAGLLIELFNEANVDAGTGNLLAGFGLHAFANEYVWQSDEQERLVLEKIKYTKGSTQQLLASMYAPLQQADKPVQLAPLNAPLVEELIQTTLHNPRQELSFAARIPAIADTGNCISRDVKQQYETNPYPRWRTPPAPSRQTMVNIIRALPGIDSSQFKSPQLKLLVAGCGTGYEPVDLARMDPSLQITALDLSRTSLAYGYRIAQELALENIQFFQGDILAVEKLNQQFDLVNSTGVLHHMENPEAGWQALCSVTKPGGVMRISLYSELARARIVAARTMIQQQNLASSNENIKQFRTQIFSLPPAHPLSQLAQSHDFYSTSGCRDLLFHVQEHRFTLLQIESMLPRLGLALIGFDVPPQAAAQFAQRHPDALLDLTKWHEYESGNPDTFSGMYQLWLQKQ